MRGEIEPQKASEVLVFGEDGYELAAVNLVRELSQKGVKSENSLCESRDEALKYAKERGIKSFCNFTRRRIGGRIMRKLRIALTKGRLEKIRRAFEKWGLIAPSL